MELQVRQEDYLPHQWEFLTSPKHIKALVTGYGGGKTYAFHAESLINHIFLKNSMGVSNGWVIYPTYDLAEELFVEPFQEILSSNYIDYDYNIAKHRFESDYGKIKIYQLQKPRYIVGTELTWIGFDEFDVESWKNCDIAWKKAVGRMRGSENYKIFFVTSPEGFKYTHKIFVEDNDGSRHLIQGKTTDNPHLPENYIKLIESTYDDTLIKAYRDGLFVNMQAGSTYYNFSRADNVKPVEYDPMLPLRVCIDFNVQPMELVLWQKYDKKPRMRIFDTITKSHSPDRLLTDDACKEVIARYPEHWKIIAYPDTSGKDRSTNSKLSDHQIIENNGFEIRFKPAHPSIVDSVNAVNKMLQGDLIMDPKCKPLINDLEQVTNKPGTREIDKRNLLLTHSSDGLRYAADFEFPIYKPFYGSVNR